MIMIHHLSFNDELKDITGRSLVSFVVKPTPAKVAPSPTLLHDCMLVRRNCSKTSARTMKALDVPMIKLASLNVLSVFLDSLDYLSESIQACCLESRA